MAAIYVRISKDSEDLGLGVARQRKDCEEKAEKNGWSIYDVYEDNDISATRSKVRPQYQRMVRDIEAGRVKAIVVYDVDRLTRTPRELEDVIGWADRLELKLASVTTDIDLSSPSGRAMARMKGTIARLEAEQMSLRLKRKMREIAESRRYMGRRPYGWDWRLDETGNRTHDLVLNKAEQAIVEECARRALGKERGKEANLHTIAQDLNRRVIPTGRPSRGWRSKDVRRMLIRPINIGYQEHNGVLRQGNWTPILDEDTYNRLVERLTDPERVVNRGTPQRYLLSGILKCEYCGQPTRRQYGSVGRSRVKMADGSTKLYEYPRPEAYRCPPPGCQGASQNREALDYMVTEYVIQLLAREGVDLFGGDDAALTRASERVQTIKAEMELAADRWAEAKMTVEQFDRFNARKRPELEQAQLELRQAQPLESMQEFAGAGAREAWEAASLERKRELLRTLESFGLSMTIGKVGRLGPHKRDIPAFNPDTVYLRAGWKAAPAS
ncbi:recombinase family protein [Nesterenkonia sp. Act20]|uniref:recombinase family protein n=1 Tax=Nesterenkonia sp. Act20 TaxID=1483432 RepID=UPI001C45E05B|nr:recombinase family protein [Nesterenkonia sp. Act20]